MSLIKKKPVKTENIGYILEKRCMLVMSFEEDGSQVTREFKQKYPLNIPNDQCPYLDLYEGE